MRIFVDDEDVTGGGLDLGYGRAEVLAAEHGGLFIGGLPGDVRLEKERIEGVVAASLTGFVGTVKDLAFIDDRSVQALSVGHLAAIHATSYDRHCSLAESIPDLRLFSGHYA